MNICTKCSREYYSEWHLNQHWKKCELMPTGDDIKETLEAGTSMCDMATNLNVSWKWISDILKTSDPEFDARGKAAKDRKVVRPPRCGCGILVKMKGQKCQWCIMESNGIKSYHDLYGE